jgi:glycosyltransferase involved in cell wall biosynthesis
MQADPLALGDISEQQRYVADLASALAREGHQVRVYTRRDGPDRPAEAPTPDGVVVEYGQAGPLSAAPAEDLPHHVPEFGRWLRERWDRGFRPDVVHAHFWLGGLAAMAPANELGIPVVHTYHSLGAMRRLWYGRTEPATRERVRAERLLGGGVDRVVAQCQSEVAGLRRLGVPRTAISVVPSGVDTGLFSPRGEQAPPADGRQRVLAVGPLGPGSGFDEMIKALAWVPDAELVIAGGPAPERLDTDPQAGRLRKLADAVGVGDRVRLLGRVAVRHLPPWYRSASVYASTSSRETFGLPAVEAMACGLPVVAYGVGGLVESVVHRVTGLLVQPNDIRGFALTLRRLLRNELDRMAYADAAVDRVQSRYDWRRIVLDVARVYGEVRR